jgi:hypothetical protein
VNRALSKEYIDLGGRLPAFERPDGTTTCLTQDHPGSTRVLTGAGGSVISRHDYLPCGDEAGGAHALDNKTPAKITAFLEDLVVCPCSTVLLASHSDYRR